MKTIAQLITYRAWTKLKLPALALIALLQRTPVVRVIEAGDEFVAASPVGNLLRSTLAAAASLGGLHTLAGATTLIPAASSTVSVAVGAAITPVAFTVSDTINIASWKIGGNIPPGLNISAVEGGGSLTGPGMLDATTPGMDDGYGGISGGNAMTTPFLSGTPTQAGLYTMTLQAFEFGGLSGLTSNTFSFSINVTGPTAPTVTTQPVNQTVAAGASTTLSVAASGSPTFQWQHNGINVGGATSATLSLTNVQPADTGLYAAVATGGTATTSDAAIVGVSTTSKVIGSGTEIAANITAPNGNVYDQVLLNGAAAAITADSSLNQITRTSFIDLNDDIVQVEFAGAGTLSLVLDNPSGPAAPVNYNQPSVAYMKGHVSIVITGANETTNVSVFSVGRVNANDPTGGFSFLNPISATNNPANNGSSLFVGHATTAYDGVADIGFIAISSANGKFGGLRASDASCFATQGMTGIYAPGVTFTGPVFISDINASAAATPVFIIGSSSDTRITGGDLLQANGQPVKVAGLTQLKFTAGGNSNNVPLPAQTNKAVLQQNGTDVTAQIVVNPSP